MNRRAQVYTLDALVALLVLVLALSVCLQIGYLKPPQVKYPSDAERILGILLESYEIQNAVYRNDPETIKAYLESMLPKGAEYFLAVFDENWKLLFKIGVEVDGVPAVAQLTGVNGTLEVRYIVFKVKL
ncbi:MAG: hypothetical protein DRN04_12940 [Thermoprotei archaeon]|nr:MAG: hypothetical protein DRN04_12940 [Thermoprotei archaeon]